MPKSPPSKPKGAKRGPKPIDPAKKRVSKTYRFAPLTLRKIQRHQVVTGIPEEVRALEDMIKGCPPYE